MGYYDQLNLKGLEASKRPKPKPRIQAKMGGAPEISSAPKVPRGARWATAAGNFGKTAKPYVKALGGAGKVIGKLATPAMLTYDQFVAPEDRLMPETGGVLDSIEYNANKAYDKGGVFPALGEVALGALPAIGAFGKDTYNAIIPEGLVDNVFAPSPESSMEFTPGAAADLADPVAAAKRRAEATKTLPPRVDLPQANTLSLEQYLLNDLIGGQGQTPAPAPAPVDPNIVPQSNNSYFINNQTGKAPGEKQYFRDMPRAFEPQAPVVAQPQPVAQAANLPTPLADAVGKMDLPNLNEGSKSYGNIAGKQLQIMDQFKNLLPALAQQKALNRQQDQDNTDRKFGLEVRSNDQDNAYRQADLAQRFQQMGETRRSGDLNRLIRLQEQKSRAAGQAVAGAPDYEEQYKQEQNLRNLIDSRFANTPEGFVDAALSLIQQGASLEGLQDAVYQVEAEQAAKVKAGLGELSPQLFLDNVKAKLGLQ